MQIRAGRANEAVSKDIGRYSNCIDSFLDQYYMGLIFHHHKGVGEKVGRETAKGPGQARECKTNYDLSLSRVTDLKCSHSQENGNKQ